MRSPMLNRICASSPIHMKPHPLQAILRFFGRLPLPKIKGLYSRLGIYSDVSPREFVVKFAGLNYYGRLDGFVDREIYYFGAYAPSELNFLAFACSILRSHRRPITFVDVGANVGQHSLFMSQHADRVIAYEPNPEVAQRLLANIELNNVANLDVVQCALGDENGFATLGSGLDKNDGSRSLLWTLDKQANIRVSVLNADQALRDANIARVDLLKLDVEGYEKHVLSGLCGTLQRDRPIILFELIGEGKGGFSSEAELRNTLYPDAVLFTLSGTSTARLAEFDWSCDEAVCIPIELVHCFAPISDQPARHS